MNILTASAGPWPRTVLLFGEEKAGKSTFFAHSGAFFIDIEGGLEDIKPVPPHRTEILTSTDQVLKALDWLLTNPHEYPAVCIDSLDWLERIIWKEVCEKRGAVFVQKVGYGEGYAEAYAIWTKILDKLQSLFIMRRMSIFLIAHERVDVIQDPIDGNYMKRVPALYHGSKTNPASASNSTAARVTSWVKDLLYVRQGVIVVGLDDEKKGLDGLPRPGRAKASFDKVLVCGNQPGIECGSRLPLPNTIKFDWGSYYNAVNVASAAQNITQ